MTKLDHRNDPVQVKCADWRHKFKNVSYNILSDVNEYYFFPQSKRITMNDSASSATKSSRFEKVKHAHMPTRDTETYSCKNIPVEKNYIPVGKNAVLQN